MGSRVNLLLVALLIASALWLVHTSQRARQLTAALHSANVQQQRLDAELRRLEAERQAQATHLRVDRVAREKLGMASMTPALIVTLPMAAAASAAATSAAAGGAR
jgi:cell division protein FtsL